MSFSAITITGISTRTVHGQDLFTIIGTGLSETDEILFRDDQSIDYPGGVSSITDTEVQCYVGYYVPAGDYSVLLKTPSAGSGQLPGRFSVLPTYTSLTNRATATEERVTIFGYNFGRNPDRIQIHFHNSGGDFNADAESCTDEKIVFIIPSIIPPGDYTLTATINGKDLSVTNSYYLQPGMITGVTPLTVTAGAGDVITVTGNRFYNNGTNARLSLSGPHYYDIPSISNSTTSLSFRLPTTVQAGRYEIRVSVDDVLIGVPSAVQYLTIN